MSTSSGEAHTETFDLFLSYASADGEWLAHRKGQSGGLYKVPVEGGPPVAVDAEAGAGEVAEAGARSAPRRRGQCCGAPDAVVQVSRPRNASLRSTAL